MLVFGTTLAEAVANIENWPVASCDCWICGDVATIDGEYGALGYYRCHRCGLVFAPNRDIDELRGLYDMEYFNEYSGAQDYTLDHARRRYDALRRVAWMMTHVRGGKLLEIGSATGAFLDVAREKQFDVTGVEPVSELAEGAERELGVPVYSGLLEDVEIPADMFDVVCGWHVLEHITRPLQALETVSRALKNRGWVFVEVPNFASTISQREGVQWRSLEPRHHVSQFTPESIVHLFERAGFDVEEVETFPFGGYMMPRRVLTNPRDAAYLVRYVLRTGLRPRSPHASKHELLRVAARKRQ